MTEYTLINSELNNRTKMLKLLKAEGSQRADYLFDKRFRDFEIF